MKHQLKTIKIVNLLETIIKGSTIIFVGISLGHGLNFIFKVILARYFGPKEYGLLSIAIALLMVISNIAILGLNQGIARFVSFLNAKKEYKKLNIMVKFGGIVASLAGLLFAFTMVLFAPSISQYLSDDPDLTKLIFLFSFVTPFLVLLIYLLGILRGLKDMKAIVVCEYIVTWLIRVFFAILIVLLGLSIKSVPMVYFISVLVVLTLAWAYIKKKKALPMFLKTKSNASVFRELLVFSFPLALSTITTVFWKRFDILLIGFFLSDSQVGFYNAALPIAMLITIFLFGINRITLPVASELFSQNKEHELVLIYKTTARWSLMITIPLFFIIFLFPDVIVNIFFGAKYVQASNALRILAVGAFINSASGSFGEYLQSYGKTKQIFLISLSGAIINFLLMILLIPKYGIEGAATATSISLIFMGLLGSFLLYMHKSILPFSKEYSRTIIIGSFTFLNMLWFHPILVNLPNKFYILAIFLLSSCIYFVVLYYSKAINDLDKHLLLLIKNRLFQRA